ncbi:hypothetical protein F2Q68_00018815 [Brassica cretica]|uniref:Uncharacterized protein n=2 Tax=Brassica cretica TaxID=69181 RepID=A0ABQ7CSQ0_BRACR|nr:hypothetical protein F2Q68_00018815 [Brassica cretica]KAF3562720.1 hypothetical protein DY000_02011250 [Brassica cretica]
MTISVSSSNSPKPQIITEMSKDLPRIMPLSTSTSCMFRVSLCQKIKQPNTPEKTRRKNQKKTYKKKMKDEKGKRGFIRPGLVFPVKKMTSVISGAFRRKKTLKVQNREQRDDSEKETTEAAKTMAVVKTKPKHYLLQKKSFWGSARIGLKILIIGQRLKTRRRRRSVSFSEGNGDEELCKKRILMGERCKPINRSGVLQYDGDGILVPEP